MPAQPTIAGLKSDILQRARVSMSVGPGQAAGNWRRRSTGIIVLLFLCVLGLRLLSNSSRGDATPAAPRPRIEVPPPVQDRSASVPRAEPRIAAIGEMAKPWSAKEFFYEDRKTGSPFAWSRSSQSTTLFCRGAASNLIVHATCKYEENHSLVRPPGPQGMLESSWFVVFQKEMRNPRQAIGNN
jgi:hypothetical protein